MERRKCAILGGGKTHQEARVMPGRGWRQSNSICLKCPKTPKRKTRGGVKASGDREDSPPGRGRFRTGGEKGKKGCCNERQSSS